MATGVGALQHLVGAYILFKNIYMIYAGPIVELSSLHLPVDTLSQAPIRLEGGTMRERGRDDK